MKQEDLFHGELVRLVAVEPQLFAESLNRWARDSVYLRLMAGDPARMFSTKKIKEWIEKELEGNTSDQFMFMIRTLHDDRLIGELELDGVMCFHGDTYVGISLGERQDWGKGYGTDAMRVLLRYAFTELNLKRVSLNVFEYNQRAVRSYEKAGFTYEGCAKEFLNRDGRRWDLIFMGILREEWVERYRLE
ncbi:GNAT family N-acetyltransferase [Chloroflexota bacterium]